jgi:hypothetical protein
MPYLEAKILETAYISDREIGRIDPSPSCQNVLFPFFGVIDLGVSAIPLKG